MKKQNRLLIDKWDNNHAFLRSNYQMEFHYGGHTFPSLDHAFLASKTNDLVKRTWIQGLAPNRLEDKDIFEQVGVREGWHATTVMKDLLEIKYGLTHLGLPGETMKLGKKLLETGNAELVYCNMDHDNFWGACMCKKCKGTEAKNILGLTSMVVRDKIKRMLKNMAEKKDKCPCGNYPVDMTISTMGWSWYLDPFCKECVQKVVTSSLDLSSDKYLVAYSVIIGEENIIYLPPPAKEAKKIKVVESKKIEPDDANFSDEWWGECGTGWAGMGSQSTYVKPIDPPVRLYRTRVIKC